MPSSDDNARKSSGTGGRKRYGRGKCENRRRGDKDRYTCYPSYKTIGKAIRRSERSVAKYVQELEGAGLVSTEPTKVTTKDDRRWNGSLLYTLLDPQRAVELYHERQLAGYDESLASGVRKKHKMMQKAERKKRGRRQQPHAEYVASHTAHEPEELPL